MALPVNEKENDMQKEKNQNFEEVLPQDYRQVKVIDASGKGFGVIMNLIALIPMVLCVVITMMVLSPIDFSEEITNRSFISLLAFVAVMVGYIILHELLHGLAYKLLTGRRLTFGLTLTVAYCGVPDIYVYRRASLIAILTPFLVFLPVFSVLLALVPGALNKLLAAYMLGMHIGGCAGDLYGAGVMLFRLRDPALLMRDTGPRQEFYLPERE